jgi:hypothetical protein
MVLDGGMLARMNFAATLATNQNGRAARSRAAVQGHSGGMVDFAAGACQCRRWRTDEPNVLLITSGRADVDGFRRAAAQQAGGLVPPADGVGEYQFV